jgi:hypothetical protein
MVYGNAEFMGYPWETLIKLYRKDKKGIAEQTVVDWANDFISYLRRYHKFGPEDFDSNIGAILSSTFDELLQSVTLTIQATRRVTKDDFENTLQEKTREKVAAAKAAKEFLVGKALADFNRKYAGVIKRSLQRFQGLKKEVAEDLEDLAMLSLSRLVFSPISSGLVVAGFGDRENFPSITAYSLDGFVGKNLKLMRGIDFQVDRKKSGCVIPFAQGDMVYRFMEGIDNSYRFFLEASIKKLLIENALAIVDRYCDQDLDVDVARKEVRTIAEKNFNDFNTKATSYRKQRFSNPIVEMVSVLPKEELAHLAESLVSLTSLKRRISRDRETVGGPIDVAVISKGDGFIWIKRKHYFDPKFNLQFPSNYFRDIGD